MGGALTVADTVEASLLNVSDILVEAAKISEGNVVVGSECAVGVFASGLGPGCAVLLEGEGALGKTLCDSCAVELLQICLKDVGQPLAQTEEMSFATHLALETPAVIIHARVERDELVDGHVALFILEQRAACLLFKSRISLIDSD